MRLKLNISFCIFITSLLTGCADLQKAELAYQQKNYELAKKHWQELADLGFPEALIGLGKLSEVSSDQQHNVALSYYQQAYQLGYDPAAYKIGQYYYKYHQDTKDLKFSRQWIVKAAKQGSIGAYMLYADMQLYGRGEEKNINSALSIYNDLSSHGYALASRRLAYLYEKGFNVKQDKNTALKYFKLALSQGSLESELDIGRFYTSGYAVKVDFDKAQAIFERFTEAENPKAAFLLSELYQRRFVIEQKPLLEQSVKWIKFSADRGYVPAKLKMIDLMLQGKTENIESAVKQLKILSKENEGKASYRLGRLITLGKIAKNKQDELKYYILAYHQNYELAAFRIAEFYYSNQKNKDDKQKYQQWLEKALQQKSDNAQFIMAELMLHGQVLPKNVTKAISIYQTLSDNDMASASRLLGGIYEQGSYSNQDLQQALFYFKRAAAQGDIYAKLDVARFYVNGLGVDKNWSLAKNIFLRYAKAGYSKAAYLLASNLEQKAMPLTQEIPEQSVYWYKIAAEQDYIPAQLKVFAMMLEGKGMPLNIAKATTGLLALSSQGISKASLRLAELYAKENEQKSTQALHFYQRAFLQGSDKPVSKLISYYQQGHGLKDKQIIKQYKASAKTGRINSSYLLAILYDLNGENEVATQWYQRAAEGNHVKSQLALVTFYKNVGNIKMANLWLVKAVEAGNGVAMLKYGEDMFLGQYMPPNKVNGLAYVLSAARLHTSGAVRRSLKFMIQLNNANKIEKANQLSKLIIKGRD